MKSVYTLGLLSCANCNLAAFDNIYALRYLFNFWQIYGFPNYDQSTTDEELYAEAAA